MTERPDIPIIWQNRGKSQIRLWLTDGRMLEFEVLQATRNAAILRLVGRTSDQEKLIGQAVHVVSNYRRAKAGTQSHQLSTRRAETIRASFHCPHPPPGSSGCRRQGTSFIGCVDGVQGQLRRGEHLWLGTVAGLKPDRVDLGASADEPLLAGYATFEAGDRKGRYYSGTAGLLGSALSWRLILRCTVSRSFRLDKPDPTALSRRHQSMGFAETARTPSRRSRLPCTKKCTCPGDRRGLPRGSLRSGRWRIRRLIRRPPRGVRASNLDLRFTVFSLPFPKGSSPSGGILPGLPTRACAETPTSILRFPVLSAPATNPE